MKVLPQQVLIHSGVDQRHSEPFDPDRNRLREESGKVWLSTNSALARHWQADEEKGVQRGEAPGACPELAEGPGV